MTTEPSQKAGPPETIILCEVCRRPIVNLEQGALRIRSPEQLVPEFIILHKTCDPPFTEQEQEKGWKRIQLSAVFTDPAHKELIPFVLFRTQNYLLNAVIESHLSLVEILLAQRKGVSEFCSLMRHSEN